MLSNDSISSAERPLVSVLIPAYNHERYIQETIRSIIAQTYENIELLIIDDGSQDSTWERINELREECEKRFANVSFQTQSNQGTSVTLNKLLEQAKGKYIFLIASDDVALPQLIEKESAFLEDNESYGLIVVDNLFLDENSEKSCVDEFFRKDMDPSHKTFYKYSDYLKYIGKFVDFESSNLYKELLLGKFFPNGYLIRYESLKRIGPLTRKVPLEDFYIRVQLARYYKMKYLDEPLFYYRRHFTNVSAANIRSMAIQNLLYERYVWNQKFPVIGNFIWFYYMCCYLKFFLVINTKRYLRNCRSAK